MKRYHICKIVFAEDMKHLLEMEIGGEVVQVELKDEIKDPNDIGFHVKDDDRPRYEVVPTFQKRGGGDEFPH